MFVPIHSGRTVVNVRAISCIEKQDEQQVGGKYWTVTVFSRPEPIWVGVDDHANIMEAIAKTEGVL